MPLRPISPRAARRRTRPRRLPDHVRGRRGLGGGAHCGLHFTPALVERLKARGIALHQVTLHVGAGTFLPVKSADTGDHRMHAEIGSVSAQAAAALNEVRRAGGRIVAVGSTSLRLLETASDEDGAIAAFEGETALFITPGYRFRAVDVLMTNFHLPRSTLFMLVAAFCGLDTIKRAMRTRSRRAIGSIPTVTLVSCSAAEAYGFQAVPGQRSTSMVTCESGAGRRACSCRRSEARADR